MCNVDVEFGICRVTCLLPPPAYSVDKACNFRWI
jgi:hypothetical protein